VPGTKNSQDTSGLDHPKVLGLEYENAQPGSQEPPSWTGIVPKILARTPYPRIQDKTLGPSEKNLEVNKGSWEIPRDF